MIKKISSIKNMAVFKDFNWNNSVKNNVGVVEFDKINVMYGRNYSGKTTASRILRALETGILSDKYTNPEFVVEIRGEANATQANLKSHNRIIRVFNEDFVKENLRFIANSEESIKSFAILGDDNNKLELEIEDKERQLGSEETNIGLLGELKKKRDYFSSAVSITKKAQSSLDDKLTDKANKAGTGIKHNKVYGEATYNVPKLKADIDTVSSETYHIITDEEADSLKQLLKEELKPDINQATMLNFKFDLIAQKTKELVQKKINVSQPIQDLLDDVLLQNWVRSGRILHEHKRNTCGFCGNSISTDLWEKLDKHFNEESERLRIDIETHQSEIKTELRTVESLAVFTPADFYSSFVDEVNILKSDWDANISRYKKALEQLNALLTERLRDIFTPIIWADVSNLSPILEDILTKYEDVRVRSNGFSNILGQKQKEAKTRLRLNDVYTFIVDIKYKAEVAKISKLKAAEDKCKRELEESLTQVTSLKKDILKLKSELKDESKGADRVNHYLNNYFGHEQLSLKAEEGESGYRFEVTRNGKKAHHLSEGECSLVAFCYFMAKLEDIETKDNNPIIWIDDPISSLDGNHIFFVFSLINSEIVKDGKFKQLFISTHSLDFLKYLKRIIPKDSTGKHLERRYFVFERDDSGSQLMVMPKYLKTYVTEFNYLFHQIYNCANVEAGDTDNAFDSFYNYGNNVRKFLEAFLYYKYPNANEKDESKLARFFGDDTVSTVLTERLSNEYSHLAGVFERSIVPIDVPEMKKTARFILDKIKQKDPEQYNALLESIDKPEVATSE